MSAAIQVWQIFFRDEQQAWLDPAFVPLDNRGFTDETLEFAVFQRLAASEAVAPFDYWGALSWRFGQKTGLTGQTLLDIAVQNPEVDVFYMNPYPEIESVFQSAWWQGEMVHPGFLAVADAFFTAAGLPVSELNRLTASREFSLCNYFVGRPSFWAAYLPFVAQALAQAEAGMPTAQLARMHSTEADWELTHNASTYVPFIVERLFAVFLRTAGRHLTAQQVRLPPREALMNPTLEDMRTMKDVAILSRSTRILALWQQKRMDYLRQYPADWCGEHLNRLIAAPVDW